MSAWVGPVAVRGRARRLRSVGRLAMSGLATVSLLLSACTVPGTAPQPYPPTAGTPTSSRAATPAPTPSGPAPSPSRPAPSHSGSRPPSVTVVMNGDLLWHNTLWFGAREDARREGHRGGDDYDFEPLLAGIEPIVAAADLAICHEEVPLAPAGGPYRNYPRFAAPPRVVRAIKATGYDVCTTASNHSLDQGFGGLVRTLDDLDKAGVGHVGTYRDARAAARPSLFTTRPGVKVAVVAGTFGTNGIPLPRGKPWAVGDISPDSLLRRAKRARAAGADVVLVALHAGTEYSSVPNAQQRSLARRLTASPDVDLVYMHHVHVVQPWTRMNGKWVVYGLGNTVAQHQVAVARGYEGVTARFTFTQAADGRFTVTRAEYVPTLVTHYQPGRPARLLMISAALPTARGSLRTRLLAAERRTTQVVTALHPAGLHRR